MKKILLLLILLLNLHITIKEGLISLELGHASAQIQYEETLDDLVVPGNAYGECQFCHAHILKTELAFHQQYQCFYREATCETCHQKYRPAQGDCSCKDNIYNNNNGNDYTICYRCGRYKDKCTCNSNNPYDINNPPGGGGEEGGTHSGGSGSSSNNNTQEDDSEDENLLSGEPMGKYWLEDSRHFTVSEVKSMIKYYDNSNIIHDLPNSFMEQGNKNDCTARSIATAAWIDSGEVEDYNIVMQYSYIAAYENNIDIAGDGVLNKDYMQMYSKYFNITEIEPNYLTSNEIKNYIDSGQCVIGTFCTGDIEYVYDPPIKNAHDVTIIGYTNDSYFCSYGAEDVLMVPKDAIECHTIHIYNGLKYPY